MDPELNELTERVMLAEDHLHQFVKKHSVKNEAQDGLALGSDKLREEYHRLMAAVKESWEIYMQALERDLEHSGRKETT